MSLRIMGSHGYRDPPPLPATPNVRPKRSDGPLGEPRGDQSVPHPPRLPPQRVDAEDAKALMRAASDWEKACIMKREVCRAA